MSYYLLTFDDDQNQPLVALLLEMGAQKTSDREWVLKSGPKEAIVIYERIAPLTGNPSGLVIQEITDAAAWDDLIVSTDVLFDLLKCG